MVWRTQHDVKMRKHHDAELGHKRNAFVRRGFGVIRQVGYQPSAGFCETRMVVARSVPMSLMLPSLRGRGWGGVGGWLVSVESDWECDCEGDPEEGEAEDEQTA